MKWGRKEAYSVIDGKPSSSSFSTTRYYALNGVILTVWGNLWERDPNNYVGILTLKLLLILFTSKGTSKVQFFGDIILVINNIEGGI